MLRSWTPGPKRQEAGPVQPQELRDPAWYLVSLGLGFLTCDVETKASGLP